MIRRPPRSTLDRSSAASDVYKRQGLKKGDTAFCQKVTDALNKYFSSGEWLKAVEKNLGPAGYKPGAGNPPTPAPLSLIHISEPTRPY